MESKLLGKTAVSPSVKKLKQFLLVSIVILRTKVISLFCCNYFLSACVNQKFGNDPHALSEAAGGANQLERELRKKYPQLVVTRQSLSTA